MVDFTGYTENQIRCAYSMAYYANTMELFMFLESNIDGVSVKDWDKVSGFTGFVVRDMLEANFSKEDIDSSKGLAQKIAIQTRNDARGGTKTKVERMFNAINKAKDADL